MQPRSLELPGADGIHLHALEWSQQGVPLVFVHGFGNDAHVWDEIAPSVSPHYHTLAITLRGHGDSGRSSGARHGAETPAVDLLVRDLEVALESLGLQRVVLVGHSLGGRVCLQFAERNPQRLAGLVLVDSGPEHDARGTARIREETRSQSQRGDGCFASVAEYARVLERQYPAARRETLARLAVHWTRARDDGRYELKLDLSSFVVHTESEARDPEAAWLRARQEATRRWETLRTLPCPALVVRGAASDVLSADVAERMVDEVLPDGRLEVIPKAGHSVMLDNPDDFKQALTRFVLG